MVTAELRRRDDQLMIVQICAARKVRAAVHSGHAASWATALLLKVKNPKAPAVMPAGIVHSATVAHSAIQTSLLDGSTIGYVASALVLATFGMKDMINLRIVAICSNFAFITYALVLSLPPILILHVAQELQSIGD
jgi:hypothetical protein